jgi:PhnB protein
MRQNQTSVVTSLAPWLSIPDATRACDFYRLAFRAVESYRLEDPDGGLVVKLSVDGAEFWVSGNSRGSHETKSAPEGGENVRMILTVSDPETFFAQALRAGATQVFAIGVEYGWKLGRLLDPFGLHWEIAHPISE